MRYRTKPLKRKYYDVFHDKENHHFVGHQTDEDGKVIGPFERHSEDNFLAENEPVTRKPRSKVKETPKQEATRPYTPVPVHLMAK